MNILRFNESGTLRTFAQFREAAGPVFDTYNVNWLSTEFATATAQSQAASQWATIQGQKDVLPLLQYLTVGDDRVRDEHAAWHGIIRPVDDPFWDSNYPINGWTCRCTTVQLSSGSLSSLSSIQSNSDPLFSNNPGKTNLVFTETGADQHPYFSVPPQDQALSDNHFNLPPP
jgi:SPP1 gp7 family putative phage head morphogenesis protein